MHNVEKSGFHRGQWVGYMDGTVWKIVKDGRDYIATERESGSRIRESTLKGISEHLDRLSANKRKGNPIMATARQIAARKEFARVMKSGGFGPRRAKAKAKSRRRNPVGRSGDNDRDPVFQEGSEGLSRARRRNPVGRSGQSDRDKGWAEGIGRSRSGSSAYSAVASVDPGGYRALSKARRKNPVSRTRSGKQNLVDEHGSTRAKNPLHRVARFTVYAARGGVRGKMVAAFPNKADAVQYAKAWVKLHKCPALIGGSRA